MKKFDFDESLTVDFQDIFDGPASVHVVSQTMWRGLNGLPSKLIGSNKGSFDTESVPKRPSGQADLREDNIALVRRPRQMLETV